MLRQSSVRGPEIGLAPSFRPLAILTDHTSFQYISKQMKRTVALSVAIGTALAIMLWFDLEESDAIFQSRLLPWVLPLIYLQDIGFRLAARLFPCQMEGFDTGCEA